MGDQRPMCNINELMTDNEGLDEANSTIPDVFHQILARNDWNEFWGTITKVVTTGAVSFLNQVADENLNSMHELCEFRVPLQDNNEDAQYPLKVAKIEGEEGYQFGLLGIINGIIATCLDDKTLIAGCYEQEGKVLSHFAVIHPDPGSDTPEPS